MSTVAYSQDQQRDVISSLHSACSVCKCWKVRWRPHAPVRVTPVTYQLRALSTRSDSLRCRFLMHKVRDLTREAPRHPRGVCSVLPTQCPATSSHGLPSAAPQQPHRPVPVPGLSSSRGPQDPGPSPMLGTWLCEGITLTPTQPPAPATSVHPGVQPPLSTCSSTVSLVLFLALYQVGEKNDYF